MEESKDHNKGFWAYVDPGKEIFFIDDDAPRFFSVLYVRGKKRHHFEITDYNGSVKKTEDFLESKIKESMLIDDGSIEILLGNREGRRGGLDVKMKADKKYRIVKMRPYMEAFIELEANHGMPIPIKYEFLLRRN